MNDPDSPDDAGERLIAASKMEGMSVCNTTGEKLGTIVDILIDKASGKAEFAVLSFGGFFGLGSHHYPLPWHNLTYDKARSGYVIDIDRSLLRGAPSYDPEDISAWEDPTYGRQLHDYYGRPRI